jgi:hypothetical protein
MPDRVDLDQLGHLAGYDAVAAMRLELIAYRAAHQAAGEQLAKMTGGDPIFMAGFEAYHKTVTDVLEQTLNPVRLRPAVPPDGPLKADVVIVDELCPTVTYPPHARGAWPRDCLTCGFSQ